MGLEKEKTSFIPLKGGTFKFQCHQGIDCFTKCCAALKLLLTPYDIIRMKNRLKLTSSEFLETFTEPRMDGNDRFPKVFLKMNDDGKGRCPFVTLRGCSIYEDRPGACRIYPLGRAALKVDREKGVRQKFFIVRESHCLGFREHRQWTVNEWLANEGLEGYNAMNDRWLEIITARKDLGSDKEVSRKLQMFSMASYNIDTFREFVFKSRFLDLFEVAVEQKNALASDDVALMQFAIDWLKFSLFQEKTMQLKKGASNH
ncbi:MAG: YkgJ family cysteine cluster protein [Pseudomonadota bacterium]